MADGLRAMVFEKDARKMGATIVYCKRHCIDHVDLLRSQEQPKDVLVTSNIDLPIVIVSPMKKDLRVKPADTCILYHLFYAIYSLRS